MTRRERGRPPHDDILTPAEWRILHAAQHGMSKRVIAGCLGVSQDAVKYHLRNIRDKLGVKTKSELKKIFKVPKGGALNLENSRSIKEVSMSTSQPKVSIGQIARTVTDLELSANWFEIVLEFPRLYSFESMAFFDCGDTRLMLSTSSPYNENESILYFRVDDIARRYHELKDKGVEFINVPHKIHQHEDGSEEWMAFFRDPDNRPLALMAQVKVS